MNSILRRLTNKMVTKSKQKNIPDGWKQVVLGKVFEFKNGVNSEKVNYGSGIKFINIMEILKHDVLDAGKIPGRVVISKKEAEKNLVKYGDVLFNRTSETPEEVGMTSVYLDTEPVIFGGFVIRARSLGKDLSDSFKKYCFSIDKVRREIIRRGQGAVRGNIGQGDLEKVSIMFPPLPEQYRIVEVLETWDKVIEKLAKKIEIKKEIKKGLIQKLLTGKTRLPGFGDKWRVVKLGDLFSERDERGIPNLPLLSITSDRGVIYQSDSNKKDTSNADKSKYLRICPDDIGYNTMRMWQGRSALSRLEGLVSPAYTILTPKKDVDSRYFAYLFKTPRVINYFFQKSQGLVSDTWQCRYRDFAIIRCTVPELTEQGAIAHVLESAENEIAALEIKLFLLRDQKKFLLNNLITGVIRVPEKVAVGAIARATKKVETVTVSV